MIGRTISHYRILEKLGGGGMGVVYKAQDLRLDRSVALKFLPSELTRDPEAKTRFIQEAKATSALDHPNVCIIHDVGETDDGQMFIVMAYYEGETLKERIQSGPLPMDDATAIAVQLARGLATAHAQGIVHRDVKPANVIVTKDGVAKILDFGLAKLSGQSRLTRSGSVLGTVAYMSPEQIRGETVDQRTDIWSFGVTMFEILTGQLPFRGEHETAIMYSILEEQPRTLTLAGTAQFSIVASVVSRCLEKNPAARYASFQEILESLEATRSMPAPQPPAAGDLPARLVKRPAVISALSVILVAVGVAVYLNVAEKSEITRVREQVLPQIERLATEEKWSTAYALGRVAEEVLPTDPAFARLQNWYSRPATITSEPPGATVLWRDHTDSASTWYTLGETPISTIRFPRGISFLCLEKNGFEPFEGPVSEYEVATTRFELRPVGTSPSGMVYVPGGRCGLMLTGLERLDSVTLPAYLIDRCEVTNEEYKRFVDAGGYRNPDFWAFPFMRLGKQRTWEEAMAEFRDATGRPGPATWELGSFPEGKGNHPVAGISWYEAAAYATFAGKHLPTIYHWAFVAGTEFSSVIVPQANYGGAGTSAVGSANAISRFGVRDMAGNVREWCWNTSHGQRFVLGGGWSDLTYMFNDAYAQDPFDRSAINGLRCVKYAEDSIGGGSLERDISVAIRDSRKERPVPDAVFRYYRPLFNYDRTGLQAVVEATDSTHTHWIAQRISFKAAYGNERMAAYLFLPKGREAPFQAVVFFPGSDAIYTRTSKPSMMSKDFDFIIKSGRAVLFPIYQSTFERVDGLRSDLPDTTNTYRDHVIMWVKDFMRSIDYLETRSDIDCSKLAYYGVSWGGAMGAIVPAMETRLKAVVLHVAGLSSQPSLPEVDALNYVSRVKAPVLMLNGLYDHFFPVETSMKPMFALLGTPTEHKKYKLYQSGHMVPRNELIRETLDWFDRYVGPVQ